MSTLLALLLSVCSPWTSLEREPVTCSGLGDDALECLLVTPMEVGL